MIFEKTGELELADNANAIDSHSVLTSRVAEKLLTVIPKGGVCPRNLLFSLWCGKADPSRCSG
jgi:hypothetical protein